MGFWSILGGEKKEKKGEVPDYREQPFVAHVERIGPKDARARLILGKLGTIEDLHSKEELHDAIRPRWNGGDYRARLFDQADRSDGYIATYSFTIPGEPWIEGKAVPLENEDKPKGAATAKIAELRQKKAELKARQEIASEEADLEQLKAKLAGQAEGHNAQVEALQAQIQEMEGRFEQQQEEFQEQLREREERQREDEKERKREERERQFREESDKRFTELMKEIKGDKAESAQVSNLQVLMNAMQTSAGSQMEMMKQIVEGIREQSNTLMSYLSQPSPAQAEAVTARQQLMETLQVQLSQLQGSEHTKFESFMQFFLTLRQLAQQDMTTGATGSVWADTAKDIAKSISQAVMTLADQRRAQLPSPQVDLSQVADVAKQQAKTAIENANRAANPAKPEVQQPTPQPAPTPIPAPEQPSPEADARRRAVVGELLSLMSVELEERPNTPTWPQFAYAHLPADMLQTLMKVQTPEDFSNVVEMLEKYADKETVDVFVSKVRADMKNALWLAEGIAQIQQLAKS